MAIGHWNNLTEAKKLTQSQLIPGIVEEDIKRNNLLDIIPVAQAMGQSIKWNREVSANEDDVSNVAIGAQLSWSASKQYDQQEVELKRKYIQRILDSFIPDVYGTINNYEATVLVEMKKAIIRNLGDALVYDDTTFGDGASGEDIDGLHAWAAVQTGTELDIELSGALSLRQLRIQHDAMKYGIDFTYIPYVIARRIDAAYQEAGLAQLATGTSGTMGSITYGVDDHGKRVSFFDGIPFLRTDFLMEETADTGEGSDQRAKSTSGNNWSLFSVRLGDVFNGEPGLGLGFGNTEMLGQFYKIVPFDKLEDFDAQGLRLVSYVNTLLGSKLALGRVYDITDAAVVF
ncbi:hypothetical protein LCGC14_0316250 [marine sediment metagenome]|uniref:Major capsid protein n=1 Tax=marine sediment metagenome TaxID=412755 RepID=A0A0F9WSD6_9ZZZZ